MISTDTAAIKRMTFHADDVCTIAENNRRVTHLECVLRSVTLFTLGSLNKCRQQTGNQNQQYKFRLLK
jgi:hypothetical protein